jgi:hypothetical protein
MASSSWTRTRHTNPGAHPSVNCPLQEHKAGLPLIETSPTYTVPNLEVSVAQNIARYALISLLVVLGAWMLRFFLPALCWAVVLAMGGIHIHADCRMRAARTPGVRRHSGTARSHCPGA